MAKEDQSSALWRASGMGMELTGAILGGALFGWLADKWLNSAPKGLIIGLIIGVIGGGATFIRSAMRMSRRAAADYRRHKAERGSADADAPAAGPRERGMPSRSGMFSSEAIDTEDENIEKDFPDDFEKW